jgi:hypothetical protein
MLCCVDYRRRHSAVSVVNRPLLEGSDCCTPYWGNIFSFLPNIQNYSEAHPASIKWVLGSFPRGYKGRDVKLKAQLHLVPKLKMSGAEPLLSVYNLHGASRKSFTFSLHCLCCSVEQPVSVIIW